MLAEEARRPGPGRRSGALPPSRGRGSTGMDGWWRPSWPPRRAVIRPLDVPAPDAVRRAGPVALPPGVPVELRDARAVAEGTLALRERSRFAAGSGDLGPVAAPGERLLRALTLTVTGGRITTYDVITQPGRPRRAELGALDPPRRISSSSPTR